jgi:hypothetical protein
MCLNCSRSLAKILYGVRGLSVSQGLEAGRGVEKHSNGMPPNLLAHHFIYGNPQWYGKPLKQRGPLPRSGGHSSRY